MNDLLSANAFKEQFASLRVAVDAVLCEFADFVDKRFTHLQMEMSGKEKEIEYLKRRLRIYQKELSYVQAYGSGAGRDKQQQTPERLCAPPGAETAMKDAVNLDPAIRAAKDPESESWSGCHNWSPSNKGGQTKRPAPQNEPGETACKREDLTIRVLVVGGDEGFEDREAAFETKASNSEEIFSQDITLPVGRISKQTYFKGDRISLVHSSVENAKSRHPQGEGEDQQHGRDNAEVSEQKSGQVKQESYGSDCVISHFMPQTPDSGFASENISLNDKGKEIRPVSIQGSLVHTENERQPGKEGVVVALNENRLNSRKKQFCRFGNGNDFIQKSEARTHTGKKNFQCLECGKKFRTSSILKNHQRIHTGEKPFVCGECNSAFNQLAHLKRHQRIHTGEKPYSCSVCKSTFNQFAHLKTHQRIHTGERPYSCSECGKAFSQLNILQRHRRIHTGEKPYSCPHCSSTFKQLSHLKRHMQIHSGEKPYACEKCGKTFSQLSILQRHYQIHSEVPERWTL
uniref:Zinc finger protein 83-like n=2 Tax=Erpetoichthys calabaricus TaxID=27687 RepID=A0A8C4S973_ERPCA